jgi:hypothetical protein
VIAQVIVGVRHADEEHDPTPQLLQVRGRVRAETHQQIRELHVAGTLTSALSVDPVEQRHRRGEVKPSAADRAVEPTAQERVVTVSAAATRAEAA